MNNTVSTTEYSMQLKTCLKPWINTIRNVISKNITRLAGYVMLTVVLAACESTGTKTPEQKQPETSKEPVKQATQYRDTELPASELANYQKALNHLKNNEYSKAINKLKKLHKNHGSHLGTNLNLAICHYKINELDKAQGYVNSSLTINPNSAQAYNLSGLIAVENKTFLKAKEAYLKAINLDKTHANSYYNLALLYDIYFQDIPEAYQNYLKYLAIVPDDKATREWVDQLQYSLDSE